MAITQVVLIIILTLVSAFGPRWVRKQDTRAALLTMTGLSVIFIGLIPSNVQPDLSVSAFGILFGTVIALIGSLFWVGSTISETRHSKSVLIWEFAIIGSLFVLLLAMIVNRFAG